MAARVTQRGQLTLVVDVHSLIRDRYTADQSLLPKSQHSHGHVQKIVCSVIQFETSLSRFEIRIHCHALRLLALLLRHTVATAPVAAAYDFCSGAARACSEAARAGREASAAPRN